MFLKKCITVDKELGNKIKNARIKAGLTRRQLAKKAAIFPSDLKNIEEGKGKVSLSAIYTLSDALKVQPTVLLF